MDDTPALWDALWRALTSLSFLFHIAPCDAMTLVTTIRQLSRAHRDLEQSLWKEIESPFLRVVTFPFACRILWCELLQRRLQISVETGDKLNGMVCTSKPDVGPSWASSWANVSALLCARFKRWWCQSVRRAFECPCFSEHDTSLMYTCDNQCFSTC